jgi:hypothetical protein
VNRIIAIILIPIFILATGIGVRMTALYCKGQLSEVGYDVQACCKDVKKGGCCEKKSQHVKVKDQFIKNEHSKLSLKIVVVDHSPFDNSYSVKILPLTYLKNYWDKAPPLYKEPHYILFQSLII